MRIIDMKEVQPGEFAPATRQERLLAAAKHEWDAWYTRTDTLVLVFVVIPFMAAMFWYPESRVAFVEGIGQFLFK